MPKKKEESVSVSKWEIIMKSFDVIPVCMTLDMCALVFLFITIICMMFERREATLKNVIVKIFMFAFMGGIIVELISFRITGFSVSDSIRFVHSLSYFGITAIVFLIYIIVQQHNIGLKTEFLEYQNQRLKAFARIYNSMHIINLSENSAMELKTSDAIERYMDKDLDAINMMKSIIIHAIIPEQIKAALDFTDLTTIADRLMNQDSIAAEFTGRTIGWFRGRFIVINRDNEGRPTELIFATVIIQSEKNKEESLIHISRTDELTNINNRRALEDALLEYDNDKSKNITLVSLDINGLKTINDTLGHAAGDELIVGAVKCMQKTIGNYGCLYRIGGDEFIALMEADKITVATSLKAFQLQVENWKGEKANSLSVSFGFITRSDFPDKTMEELMIMADRKMYEMKKKHYMERTFDRRNR